jgi:hypothetical protein
LANEGRPGCLNASCDGHLHHEFLTGLNQSTSQMMRLGGMGLIGGALLFGAPFFIDNVVRMSAGVGGAAVAIAVIIVPVVAGVMILRHRTQRMSVRTEQNRCNKCGAVFPA